MRTPVGHAPAAIAVILAWAGTARADGAGTSAFQFLNLGAGARIEAMGEAGTAVADGVDALTWNPARLRGEGGRGELAVSYFNWLQDVRVGQLGGVWPLGKATVGLGARSLRVSDFSNVPGEDEVGQSDLAVGAAAAYPVAGALSAGAGLKVVRSSLAGEHATGLVGDVGLNYRWVEGWDVAAAVRNFGPSIGYGTGAEESLPTQGAFAIGAKVGELRLDSEVLWEDGPGLIGAIGAEYQFRDRIALRAGSRIGESSDGAREPWAAGIGIAARSDLELEYAFRDGVFEASHRLGIRWVPGRSLGGADAGSSREFYIDVLNEALERSLATLPPRPEGTVLVRSSAENEAAEVITGVLVRRLRNRGWDAEAGKPAVAFPDTMSEETRAQYIAKGIGVTPDQPLLQYEVRDSRYEILGTKRARWVGPQSVDRRAAVELALTLTSPGEPEPLWTGSATGEKRELVAAARIPSSTGYPQARSESGEAVRKMHPLVEPAIVGGLVAGLAVIFFSNRDVGQ